MMNAKVFQQLLPTRVPFLTVHNRANVRFLPFMLGADVSKLMFSSSEGLLTDMAFKSSRTFIHNFCCSTRLETRHIYFKIETVHCGDISRSLLGYGVRMIAVQISCRNKGKEGKICAERFEGNKESGDRDSYDVRDNILRQSPNFSTIECMGGKIQSDGMLPGT